MASHYIATYGASKFIVQMDTWDSLFVLILVLLLQSCPGTARQVIKSDCRMDGFTKGFCYEHKLAIVNLPNISLE